MVSQTRPADRPTSTPLSLAAPCARCSTTGGGTRPNSTMPVRRRGLCATCYSSEFKHGTHENWPTIGWHGEMPDHAAMIATLAASIRPEDIARNCATAARYVAYQAELGDAIAVAWAARHPEHLTAEDVARLFAHNPAARDWNRWTTTPEQAHAA